MNDPSMELSEVTETDDIENLYLTFDVAQETYAVNIGHVTEIVGMQHISAMPDMPDFIRGAMNLRGKVIPVMDVRLRFGLPWRDYDDRTTIIVLDLNGTPTGLVVDRVTDVLTIPRENIDPPPHWHGHATAAGEQAGQRGFIRGLGKHQDSTSGQPSVAILLDVPLLLSTQERAVE